MRKGPCFRAIAYRFGHEPVIPAKAGTWNVGKLFLDSGEGGIRANKSLGDSPETGTRAIAYRFGHGPVVPAKAGTSNLEQALGNFREKVNKRGNF